MTTRISAAEYRAALKKRPRKQKATSKATVDREPVPDESNVAWRRVILDVAPATKERHRTKPYLAKDDNGEVVAKARTYTPRKTERFESAVKTMLRIALGPNHQPLRGRVALSLEFGIPQAWREQRVTDKPDLDNIEKALKDACNTIVYLDDAQVTWVNKRKHLVQGNGWIVLGFGPDKSPPPSSELAELGYDPFNVDANRGP